MLAVWGGRNDISWTWFEVLVKKGTRTRLLGFVRKRPQTRQPLKVLKSFRCQGQKCGWTHPCQAFYQPQRTFLKPNHQICSIFIHSDSRRHKSPS